MQKPHNSVLCDPITHKVLERVDGGWRNSSTGRVYPLREGIVCFLDPARVTGLNRKYETLYDRIAFLYDATYSLFQLVRPAAAREMRKGYLDEIEMREQASVLEVSIGTGRNVTAFPATVEFDGLDLSFGMLRRCQRNLRKWHRTVRLTWGEAEHLPCADNAFDIVFHVGGINFFSDRAAAIREMIRVARPGTKIVIADETEEVVQKQYARTPFLRPFFRNRETSVTLPVDLVPPEMREIQCKEVHKGKVYCLSFRKP
jgi:ubiquinone/menaquinone biosynthesis C-methylase UbiE